jgi:DNA-3-methyladenine glycosylase II
MTDAAHEHLALVDPVMAGLIQASGRCVLQAKPARTPFQALVRAVAHQQLHGAAAETILRRFLASFPGKRFPTPRDVLKAPDSVFRKAGFSASKMAAIRDIAAKTTAKVVPGNKAMAALGDEEIVERLTECRGIGVWSVQMLMRRVGHGMFGRPNAPDLQARASRRAARRRLRRAERVSPRVRIAGNAEAEGPARIW